MMRKLPDCPKCSELDLYGELFKDGFRLRCRECGWNSGIVLLAEGVDLDDAIVTTVGKAIEAVSAPPLVIRDEA